MATSYPIPDWIKPPESLSQSYLSGLQIGAHISQQQAQLQQEAQMQALKNTLAQQQLQRESQIQMQRLEVEKSYRDQANSIAQQKLAEVQQVNQQKVQDAARKVQMQQLYTQRVAAGGEDPNKVLSEIGFEMGAPAGAMSEALKSRGPQVPKSALGKMQSDRAAAQARGDTEAVNQFDAEIRRSTREPTVNIGPTVDRITKLETQLDKMAEAQAPASAERFGITEAQAKQGGPYGPQADAIRNNINALRGEIAKAGSSASLGPATKTTESAPTTERRVTSKAQYDELPPGTDLHRQRRQAIQETVMASDEFGGVAVEEPQTDEWGGIAVLEEPQKPKGTFLPETSKEPDARVMGMGEPLITLPRIEGSNPLFQAFMSGVTEQPPARSTSDTAAAAINVAKTLPEFITSPIGIATAPIAAAGGLPARLLGLGFAGQMGLQVPESAREAGRLSVEGTPQEAKEAMLGLGSNIVLPAALAGASLGRPLDVPRTELLSEEPRPGAQVPVTPEQVTPGAPEPVETKLTPADLEPGLMVGDKPLTGGEDHGAIRNKALVAADTPEQVDTILAADKDDSKHVFVDKNNNVLTREQAADALGEKEPLQSSRLRELQKTEPATTEPAAPDILKDSTGKSLVALHGTANKEFKPSEIEYSDNGHSGPGIYFTTDPQVADLYSTAHKALPKGRVLTATIVSKKPFGSGVFTAEEAEVMNKALLKNNYTPVKALAGKTHKWLFERKEDQAQDTWDLVMRDAGYDSVRIPGADEDELVVYDPKQIIWHNEPALGTEEGMGAARLGEVGQQPMGEAAPTHGIAQRVREAQVGTGALGPEAAQPGVGISAPDSVERGRELLTQGLSPEQAVFEFNKTKAITADSMAVVRAHAEKLWRAAVDADRQAPNSPEAEAAWESYNKFTTDIKPMQTEWHRIGMAQQGEVNLDDGSFISMRQKFKEATGRDLDEVQKDKAHKIAKDNEGAEVATDKAQKTVKDEINKELKQADDYTEEELANLKKLEEKGSDWPAEIEQLRKKWAALKPGTEKDLAKINYEREKAAFDSVTTLLKDKATRDANIENRKRVEEQERKLELAKIDEARERAAGDASSKTVRDAAARRAELERKLQANPDQRVWAKVREYMAAGVDDFNDMVAKVATDLGMTQAQVKRWIAFKPRIKKAVDEAWLKQQRERTLKETARRWVDDQSKAAWMKYASKVPSAAFGAKVFGHGFVAMGTHAPLVPFIPKYQSAFARNAGKMYRMVVDPTYYESQVQELQRQPNFAVAKRAGLQNDPHGWEDYTNPILTTIFGPLASAGNRGYFALKLLRQDIFDVDWNALPKTVRIPQVAKAIADATNHITGVTKAVAPRGLHVGLFAPRLLASRFALAFGDPARAADTFLNWKNADIGDKYFAITQAKQKAWILGTYASLLALNQAVLSATGSKQNINFTNPLEGDWMKFKMSGKNVAWGTPFLTLARMPARLWAIREGPKGRMRNIVYPEETTAKFAFEYARSQASPFAQPLLDLWLKSDWQGRPLPSSTQPVPSRLRKRGVQPYTWGEWATQSFTPIPFEEAQKEVWHAMGLGTSAQNAMSRASLLDSAIMGLTGSRIQDDWNVSRTTDTPSSR